jgi:large subunit ribosomal protein L5
MQTLELKNHYFKNVVTVLRKSHGYKNPHQVPYIEKVVINSGISSSLDKNAVQETAKEIAMLTGQQPIITKARKSISNFKLREGMPVGVKVTLRGANMYEFLYRLIAIALPGIRDFRGISSKFDGNGNYNLGITDHTIFPEISVDGYKRNIGLDICIVTSAKTDAEALKLLKFLGMPFRTKKSAPKSSE